MFIIILINSNYLPILNS